jgi:hypothetical protein
VNLSGSHGRDLARLYPQANWREEIRMNVR